MTECWCAALHMPASRSCSCALGRIQLPQALGLSHALTRTRHAGRRRQRSKWQPTTFSCSSRQASFLIASDALCSFHHTQRSCSHAPLLLAWCTSRLDRSLCLQVCKSSSVAKTPSQDPSSSVYTLSSSRWWLGYPKAGPHVQPSSVYTLSSSRWWLWHPKGGRSVCRDPSCTLPTLSAFAPGSTSPRTRCSLLSAAAAGQQCAVLAPAPL